MSESTRTCSPSLIKPMAIPVGIAPTMKVRDETVRIEVAVSDLAITEHMIWLGADVTLADAAEGAAAGPEQGRPVESGRTGS